MTRSHRARRSIPAILLALVVGAAWIAECRRQTRPPAPPTPAPPERLAEHLQEFVDLLQQDDPYTRDRGVTQLGEQVLMADTPEAFQLAIPPLIERLEEDPAASVRASAAMVLGGLCVRENAPAAAETVVPHLQVALQDPHVPVRVRAGGAIARIGKAQRDKVLREEGIDALLAALESDPGVYEQVEAELNVVGTWDHIKSLRAYREQQAAASGRGQ